jgi:hypothetical protein
MNSRAGTSEVIWYRFTGKRDWCLDSSYDGWRRGTPQGRMTEPSGTTMFRAWDYVADPLLKAAAEYLLVGDGERRQKRRS